MKYIFHGSNAKLLDDFLVSGTYFTEDLEIALKYGNTIYAIDCDSYSCFTKNWEGYFVSSTYIPLQYLKVLKLKERK